MDGYAVWPKVMNFRLGSLTNNVYHFDLSSLPEVTSRKDILLISMYVSNAHKGLQEFGIMFFMPNTFLPSTTVLALLSEASTHPHKPGIATYSPPSPSHPQTREQR